MSRFLIFLLMVASSYSAQAQLANIRETAKLLGLNIVSGYQIDNKLYAFRIRSFDPTAAHVNYRNILVKRSANAEPRGKFIRFQRKGIQSFIIDSKDLLDAGFRINLQNNPQNSRFHFETTFVPRKACFADAFEPGMAVTRKGGSIWKIEPFVTDRFSVRSNSVYGKIGFRDLGFFTNKYFFKSTDNGLTWKYHSNSGWPAWAKSFAGNGFGKIVIVGKFGSIDYSEDDGQTFQRSDINEEGFRPDLEKVIHLRGQRFLAVGGGVAAVSHNGGETWTLGQGISRGFRIRDVAYDGLTTIRIVGGLANSSKGQMMISKNLGRTWFADSSIPNDVRFINQIAVSPSQTWKYLTVIANGNISVVRTLKKGSSTWTEKRSKFQERFQDLAYSGSNRFLITTSKRVAYWMSENSSTLHKAIMSNFEYENQPIKKVVCR